MLKERLQRVKEEINEPWESWIEFIRDTTGDGHNKLVEAHMKLRERAKQLTVRSKEHEVKIES